MLNHIVIMGRLTRDPELRYTQSNLPVASFRVAVDRDYGGRDGAERQTDFIDCVAWRSSAEFVSKYFTKGSMIVVSGRLQMREWTDKENNRRTSAEIVADSVYFGESKRRDDGSYRQTDDGGYRGCNDYRKPEGGNNWGENDRYRQTSSASYRGSSGNGYHGGNNDSYSGGIRGYDDSGSGFTDLSDTDGDLPF